MTIRISRPLGAVLAACALSAGCSAHLQTKTVQASDTYDLWASRMEHMPFVFHHSDGHVAVYDVHGDAWKGSNDGLADASVQRVEVFDGTRAGASTPLCTPAAAHTNPANTGTGVVAALCDRERLVVSFSDTPRDRVVAAKATYVPRVRHLLLEGIWESVAQEPAPLHT